MSVWWWICSSDPKISTFPQWDSLHHLGSSPNPEKPKVMEWVDGVKLTDANGIRNLGRVFFVYFFKNFSSDFLVGVFFFIGWKVRQSFPLTVISRVTTLFIGVISPVNQYQVVWLPFLLGFFQKSHDSYIPRVFAFLWVDLFFWFGKKAAFNVQMMQVRHVVFQKVIDMPPAFGQHFCVWFQTLSMATFTFIYVHIYHISCIRIRMRLHTHMIFCNAGTYNFTWVFCICFQQDFGTIWWLVAKGLLSWRVIFCRC